MNTKTRIKILGLLRELVDRTLSREFTSKKEFSIARYVTLIKMLTCFLIISTSLIIFYNFYKFYHLIEFLKETQTENCGCMLVPIAEVSHILDLLHFLGVYYEILLAIIILFLEVISDKYGLSTVINSPNIFTLIKKITENLSSDKNISNYTNSKFYNNIINRLMQDNYSSNGDFLETTMIAIFSYILYIIISISIYFKINLFILVVYGISLSIPLFMFIISLLRPPFKLLYEFIINAQYIRKISMFKYARTIRKIFYSFIIINVVLMLYTIKTILHSDLNLENNLIFTIILIFQQLSLMSSIYMITISLFPSEEKKSFATFYDSYIESLIVDLTSSRKETLDLHVKELIIGLFIAANLYNNYYLIIDEHDMLHLTSYVLSKYRLEERRKREGKITVNLEIITLNSLLLVLSLFAFDKIRRGELDIEGVHKYVGEPSYSIIKRVILESYNVLEDVFNNTLQNKIIDLENIAVITTLLSVAFPKYIIIKTKTY
ncbi:MAG: hypothetical protein GSR81_02635 [Desulfurococcales archaeon]|nr:hypothetical protein [Desulfurococcales archaeon]